MHTIQIKKLKNALGGINKRNSHIIRLFSPRLIDLDLAEFSAQNWLCYRPIVPSTSVSAKNFKLI